jgi:E1A/CREB-binding protein
MQRIKRGATYYTERTKANHWCDACYDLIGPEDAIILDDGSEIQKKDLQEFKNDALPEEAWVNCDGCQSWVHQICALFNGRTNKSNAKYTCPHCYLRKGDEIGFPISDKKFDKGAKDLASTKMSTAIESGLEAALGKAYELRAKELGVSLEEVEKADGLTVRIISNVEKKQLIGEEMYERYSSQGCPSEFPVHSKCIGLFQKIHGVDTLLFALYVYEYGQECPAPNKRRVYISYLDSVQYFEPKVYRTTAYHAILVEYLRFVKTRGFHTAHIWSCPPAPGDDYIFYSHPTHQPTPREDMLRTWYHEMLDKAKAQGIVIRSTTLYDEYFANDGVDKVPGPRDDPTCLPYFEGDYIPGEIETIIRHIRNDNRKSDSTGDEVMNRLGHNIGKMKDNFIVVHLRNRRFAAAVERGEDVSQWTEDSDEELIRSKRAKISGKDSGSILVDKGGSGDAKVADEPNASEGPDTIADSAERTSSAIVSAVSGHLATLCRKHSVVADTSDEDPTIESEMFESRQQFLNYCQTNHCQFDELRRAKHSTMMVLFQLHNPSAPKFLQQCSACYRDMTHGYRYHCNNCSNFELCEDCYKPVTTGLWAQRDERFAHDPSHTFKAIDMEATGENEKSPAERQKALKDHIELLEHAGTCPGPPHCSLQNCERMKKLFEHVRSCEIKPKTGCKICTRLLSLCVMHARLCPNRGGQCPIPFCDRIRERNLRVRRQQQLMDDRRRQAQNELYHAGGAATSS